VSSSRRPAFDARVAVILAGAALLLSACNQPPGVRRPPNIILIVADDLGYGELGSYGQQKIRTPRLDRMADEGMRFTQHYSGSPVCAPSRDTLLTGLHTGHAYIRNNDELGSRGDVWNDLSLEGQRPLLPGTTTIGTLLQQAGYTTAAMGKWGLGGPGSTGEPNRQGFDHFFGYLCQRIAHSYYPPWLWRDGEKVMLDNEYFLPHQQLPPDADVNDPAVYARFTGKEYSHDLIVDEALGFVRSNRDRPFFLYLPFTIPHVALQVQADALQEYEGAFPETPYVGTRAVGTSYLPHRTPHAAYAAMITRMDRDVGRIVDLVGELGLDENTVVFFTSDNGPSWVGGADPDFFGSRGPLRGRKAQVCEGGIRVPLIARWPGRIPEGSVSDLPSAFWDFMPTLAELAGTTAPTGIDGLSFVPTLVGRDADQRRHDYLYWEYGGAQVVRLGEWKGVRPARSDVIELYDLSRDIGETTDLASSEPELAGRIEAIMRTGRTESELFPLRRR
jgi:arylsulfatase A